jgi:hypothetical protein
MELFPRTEFPLGDGRIEYQVEVRFAPDEAARVMAAKDLFSGEGMPLDPSVQVDGVAVFFDTPLQIAGLMIADEDTTARFVCTPDRYQPVVKGIDAYLRTRLAPLWGG